MNKIVVGLLLILAACTFSNAIYLDFVSHNHCVKACKTKGKEIADVGISEYQFCACVKNDKYELFKMDI